MMPPVPPAEERPPLLLLALLFVGYACSYFHRADLAVLAPVWAKNGNHPDLAAALPDIASLGLLVYALGKFAGGVLAHRFGGRRLFVTALAGAAIAEFTAAMCTTPTTFAASRVAGMAVLALAWPSLGHLVAELTPRRRLAFVMAFFSQSYLIGDAAVRAVLAAVVAEGGGATTILRTSGSALAGMAVVLAVAFAATSRPARSASPSAPANAHIPPTAKAPLVWLAGMNFALAMTRESLSYWSPLLLVEWCELPADDAVRASALLPLASGAGALLSGALADRGPRSLAAVMVLPLVVGSLLLLTLAAPFRSFTALVLLLASVAACTAMPQSLASGVLPLRAGARGGARRLGFVDGCGTLGSVFAASGVARLRQSWGMPTAMTAMAAALGVAAIAAAGFLIAARRDGPPRHEPA